MQPLTVALPGVSARRAMAALLALSLCAFAFVTTELLPIGLLTVMADDLDKSVSATGMLVTVYAVVVVLASVPLTHLTRAVPRRRLLLVLLATFVVTTAMSAAAPSYLPLLLIRLITALSQAVFWSVVGPMAVGMFDKAVRGRAIAVLFTGGSVAPVIGVPAGTWLGQQAGWRAAFVGVTVLSVAAALAVAAFLPGYPADEGSASAGERPNRLSYRTLLVLTALAIGGTMTAYTYVTPFLLDVSHYAKDQLPVLLFGAGLADLIGVQVTGRVVDRSPRIALMAPLILIPSVLFGMFFAGSSRVAAAILVALLGLGLASATTALMARCLIVAPGNVDIASAALSSAYNVGIVGGSLLGGGLVAGFGVRSTALFGGLIAAAALALALSERVFAARAGVPVLEQA